MINAFSSKPNFSDDAGFKYVTLTAAGCSDEVVSYGMGTPMTDSEASPFFRLGMINNELRIHCELILSDGSRQELCASEPLAESREERQIAVTIESKQKQLQIVVNGKVESSATLKGTPKICEANLVACGDGGYYKTHCTRYWRSVLTPEFLNQIRDRDTTRGDWFTVIDAPSEPYRIYIGQPNNPIACMAVPNFDRFAAIESQLSMAKRVLSLAGEVGELTDSATIARAFSTVREIRIELQKLIDDTQTTDPDLLIFLKENAAAIVFFEPSATSQWREVAIQNHGQIDFVVKLSSGRFSVIEIESPTAQIFTKKDEFTSHMNHAIEQVRNWMRGSRKHGGLLTEKFNVSNPDLFDGYVVIGRASEALENFQRSDRWSEQGKDATKVKTWDDVLNQALTLENNFANPEVQPKAWE